MEDERRIEEIEASYYEYGWSDYVESPSRELVVYTFYHENGEVWHRKGWDAAKAQEEQQGVVLFLSDELLKRMSAGGEWHGGDFDKPMEIVKKIQIAYRSESKS
jgi:hypothetical protein